MCTSSTLRENGLNPSPPGGLWYCTNLFVIAGFGTEEFITFCCVTKNLEILCPVREVKSQNTIYTRATEKIWTISKLLFSSIALHKAIVRAKLAASALFYLETMPMSMMVYLNIWALPPIGRQNIWMSMSAAAWWASYSRILVIPRLRGDDYIVIGVMALWFNRCFASGRRSIVLGFVWRKRIKYAIEVSFSGKVCHRIYGSSSRNIDGRTREETHGSCVLWSRSIQHALAIWSHTKMRCALF